jgi:hypothetical protein
MPSAISTVEKAKDWEPLGVPVHLNDDHPAVHATAAHRGKKAKVVETRKTFFFSPFFPFFSSHR